MPTSPFQSYLIPLTLSAHARARAQERQAPELVLEAWSSGMGADFIGRPAAHGRTNLRIVRTLSAYWVAPHVNGFASTVYAVPARDIVPWGMGRLLHPEQTVARLRRLAVHVTLPDEEVTAELAAMWMSDGPLHA